MKKHLIFISTIIAVLLCPRVLGRAYTEAGDGTLNVSAVSADQVRICSAVLLDGFEQTGDVNLKQVVRTFVKEADELVHITVNGDEIVCTNKHPFYSPRKGWTAACQLRAGDILVIVNGEYVVVEKVQHEILENPVRVYNFEVEGYHTYYVGCIGVLVHNTCSSLQRGFKSSDELLKHYGKHNSEFGSLFSSPDEYLSGANYVIENGEFVSELNGYIKFFGAGGQANYAFVGLTQDGAYITTFGIRSVAKLAESISWLVY